MEITIPLPNSSSINTYKELMGYLRQLELAVHYAQKMVENAEKTGLEISEDTFVSFEHPGLDYLKTTTEVDLQKYKNFVDEFSEELQSVSLKINLQ